MSGQWGNHLKVSIFGESHGPAIGITVDGLPSGMEIDFDAVAFEMARRAPGKGALSTSRREKDEIEVLSGVYRGFTTGTPISAIIRNTDARSADYGETADVLRPGHADYTGHIRYRGFEDHRGGGHFSGRITAPMVFCGALCKQLLRHKGIGIYSHIARMGGVEDVPFCAVDPCDDRLMGLGRQYLPLLEEDKRAAMEAAASRAKEAGDSIGGVIECGIYGVPAGLGAPFFDSVESVLSHLLFAIPGIKGVEFGLGFGFGDGLGSTCNDGFAVKDGKITLTSNHSGGVMGGITSGMPILFRAVMRPTASIGLSQKTVSLEKMEDVELAGKGRHDGCIVPRAIPVVEAAAAMAMVELLKEAGAWQI